MVDATSEGFFSAITERSGGPIEPQTGFKEVYTEIYIKRAKPKEPEPAGEEGNLGEPEHVINEDEDPLEIEPDEETKGDRNSNAERIKKKRGRKPKSFYLQQQQE
jgi:hypothetical protein